MEEVMNSAHPYVLNDPEADHSGRPGGTPGIFIMNESDDTVNASLVWKTYITDVRGMP